MTLLNGLRVLNTRPLEQGKTLSKAIRNAGGLAIEFPALAIEPTSTTWLARLPDQSLIQQAIFISSNAVNYFFESLKKQKISWDNTIKVTAVGNASASALANWAISADYIPSIANSESLLKLPLLQHVKNQTLLLIKGEGGRDIIANTLIKRGAQVVPLSVYRRIMPNYSKHQINSLWREDQVDIILFTSQQAIQNLFTILGSDAKEWLFNKSCLVISNRLKDEAYSLGIKHVFTCSHDSIINALAKKVHNQG